MDARLENAKARLEDGKTLNHIEQNELLAFALERYRVNVGLVSENTSLKKQLRTPDVLDLSDVPVIELVNELARRHKES